MNNETKIAIAEMFLNKLNQKDLIKCVNDVNGIVRFMLKIEIEQEYAQVIDLLVKNKNK
jgi:hypothetical protein